jgi:hypothetical protein
MGKEEIEEIADKITRNSHRVKNAGNDELYRQGLSFARKIRSAGEVATALRLEDDYLEILRREYSVETPLGIASHDAILAQDAYGDDEGDTHFSPKDDSVEIPEGINDKVGEIADGFFTETGKDLVVTDGARDAEDQAKAMFDKLELGDDLQGLYSNKDAAAEIEDAYNEAQEAGKSDEETKEAMQAVIEEQIGNDVFISRHLTEKAFDVRSRDMTADEKAAFKKSVEDAGGKVITEGKPAHFHVQFPDD